MWPEEKPEVLRWNAPIAKASESKQLPPPVPRLAALDASSESTPSAPNQLKHTEVLKEVSHERSSPHRLRTFAAPTMVSKSTLVAKTDGEEHSNSPMQPSNVTVDSDVLASEEHCVTDIDHCITDLEYTETEAATDLEFSATDATDAEAEAPKMKPGLSDSFDAEPGDDEVDDEIERMYDT
jgi:hypothetical protein